MEHQEAHELLPAYLDKDLDIAATRGLERHLENCGDCQRQLAQQSAVSARIRSEAEYFNAPAQLAQHINAALAQERTERSPHFLSSFNWKFSWLNAGGAMITLAVAAWSIGLYLQMPSASERLAEEVVAAHVRSLQVDHLSDIASSDQHTVKPWFNGKLDFSPSVVNFSPQGFPLVGGRLDYLNGRAVAALIYRHRQHPINLYISPSSGRDVAAQMMERQGYHLVHWTLQGMDYWAVSDLAANELAEFAQLLRTDATPS